MKWISTRVRLPEFDGHPHFPASDRVLACIPGDGFCYATIGRFTPSGFSDESMFASFAEPTHWAELELPK